MKVTITATGDVIVDTDDTAKAAALIAALRNGTTSPGPSRKKSRRKKKTVPTAAHRDEPLSRQLTETWQYMVDHGSSSGVSFQEVAAGLGIKEATATYRLTELRKKGLAYRTQPGMYAPGEGQDWAQRPPAI